MAPPKVYSNIVMRMQKYNVVLRVVSRQGKGMTDMWHIGTSVAVSHGVRLLTDVVAFAVAVVVVMTVRLRGEGRDE